MKEHGFLPMHHYLCFNYMILPVSTSLLYIPPMVVLKDEPIFVMILRIWRNIVFFSQRCIITTICWSICFSGCTERLLLENNWVLFSKSELVRHLYHQSRSLCIQNLRAVQADKMWSDGNASLCVFLFIICKIHKTVHFIPFDLF